MNGPAIIRRWAAATAIGVGCAVSQLATLPPPVAQAQPAAPSQSLAQPLPPSQARAASTWLGSAGPPRIDAASIADPGGWQVRADGPDLPVGRTLASAGREFPALPPDPRADEEPPLPPLDEELWNHGGSYMYHPEGDRLNWPDPDDEHQHYELLRLPEDWQAPEPVTLFSEFLGADPIFARPWLKWPGAQGYMWDLRFVGAGGYDLFAFAYEQDGRSQSAIGHQLLVDLDLQLTGTERFHVLFRPLGKDNTGGSYYQFSDPAGYVNNATGEPARFWFEGELHSILGSYTDPFAVRDVNFVVGKWALALQNGLLINDEILALGIGKNTIYVDDWSTLNVQGFYAFNDVDTFGTSRNQLWGANALIDYQRHFSEVTYGYLQSIDESERNSHYAAFSHTRFLGTSTVAARALFKWGSPAAGGDGQLFVVESNRTRVFDENLLGVEKGVFYSNLFYATPGWRPISGGNFNRLRVTFETNPLIRIAAGLPTDDVLGAAAGVQLFRHHADESFIPEIACELQQGVPVWGIGCRYLRNVGSRAFLEVFATAATSEDTRFERAGVFTTYHIVF